MEAKPPRGGGARTPERSTGCSRSSGEPKAQAPNPKEFPISKFRSSHRVPSLLPSLPSVVHPPRRGKETGTDLEFLDLGIEGCLGFGSLGFDPSAQAVLPIVGDQSLVARKYMAEFQAAAWSPEAVMVMTKSPVGPVATGLFA